MSTTPRPAGQARVLRVARLARLVLLGLLGGCSGVEPVSPPVDDPPDVIVKFGALQALASDPVAVFDGPTLALAWIQRAGGYAEVRYGAWTPGAPPELVGLRIDQGRGNAEAPAIACAEGSCLVAWSEHEGLGVGKVQVALLEIGSPCRVVARASDISRSESGPLRVYAIAGDEFLVLAEEGALVRREGDRLAPSFAPISRAHEGAPVWELYLSGERARLVSVAPGEGGACLRVERRVEVGCLPVSDAARDCASSSWTEDAWVQLSANPSLFDSCDPLAAPPSVGRVSLSPSHRRQEAQVRWDAEPRPTTAIATASATGCPVEPAPEVEAALVSESESEASPPQETEDAPPQEAVQEAVQEAGPGPRPVQVVEQSTEPQMFDSPSRHRPSDCPNRHILITVHRGPARVKCVRTPETCAKRPTCACLDGLVCPKGTCRDIRPGEIACMISR